MRVYFGGLLNETNVSSPIPCAADDFIEMGCPWAADRDGPFASLLAMGAEIVVGPNLVAQPAGLVTRAAYDELSGRLLDDIERCLPLDAVLLNLHGAMAAEHVGDCEGDILTRVRALVGPGVFVGATLDPHCHISEAMTGKADMLVAYKEYPHTDIDEATASLARIAASRLGEDFAVSLAIYDCRQVGIYYTTHSRMRSVVEAAKALEAEPGLLSVSIAHGFPWGDDPDLGTKVLAYARGPDAKAQAMAAAEKIGQAMIELRGACGPTTVSTAQALRRAAQEPGVTVAGDIADNAGGGAPSDSTFVLQALLAAGFGPSAVGPIWDPGAVALCFKAGLGAVLPLRVGGKTGRVSGQPVDVICEVIGLARDHEEAAPGFGGLTVQFGDVAGIRIGGVAVVLTQRRMQGFSPAVFEAAGVRVREQRLVVVKSTQHFHAGFAPLADRILYIDAGGALSYDFAALPRTRTRPDLWPVAGGDQ